MDEPTSVLTPQEVKLLFETLRRLASEGCSILYISHKLQEIRSLCSAATIMRGGRVVSSCDPRQETSRGLAEMMIGSELAPARYNDNKNLGVARLVVDHLSMKSDDPFGTNLKDISFDVRAGEIFGIAGVAGNGQIELLAALSGERCLIPGSHTILMDGKPVGHYGPRVRRERGLAFLPEERLGRGAVADMSLSENSLLGSYRREGLVERGFINSGELQTFAGQIINDYQVVARGTQSAAKNLSGGNLQKYMIGREILQNPGVLLAAHPTWGVDAGAAAAIHLALIALARSGSAILLVSEDLDELFAISNRLAVIQSGTLSRSMLTKDTSAECCGLLMGGVTGSVGEAATGA
ncbi:MAG: ATP-binding cassette domain-containing protein, partial [Rhodospirillales bacterium]